MSERRRQNSSRFSLEEVIAEVQNDSDSVDSDLYSSSDTDENDNDSFASSFVQNENQENGWGNDLNSSRESPPEIDSDSDYEPENLSKRTRTIESSDDSDSNTIANTPQVTRDVDEEPDELDTEMSPDDDSDGDSDDEAPDDVGFHESRESVLSQLKSALKQVDVEKQKKKEKRKLIDEHFRQQKLRKKEQLAKVKLPDDILDSIDEAIPKKVRKIASESPAKEQNKKQKKNKMQSKESVKDEQTEDVKREDYIAFTDEASGVQVADIKYVEKQIKSAAQVAAEFKKNRLYGKHINRESNEERLAKKEKRRFKTR